MTKNMRPEVGHVADVLERGRYIGLWRMDVGDKWSSHRDPISGKLILFSTPEAAEAGAAHALLSHIRRQAGAALVAAIDGDYRVIA